MALKPYARFVMGISEVTIYSSTNFYVFGVLSIVLNTTLIFTLCNRSLTPIGTYKYLMIISSILDALFSLTSICASPTFIAVSKMNSVLIIGNDLLLPRELTVIALILFLLLLFQSVLTPPCLFVFRYLQICKSKFLAKHSHLLRYFLLIPTVIALTKCILFCIGSWPTTFDRNTFDSFVTNITKSTEPIFLVASLSMLGDDYDDRQSILLTIFAILLISSMVLSLIIMLFCTQSIMTKLLQLNFSVNRRLQIQVCNTLLIQFGVPFIFVHVPFYVCVLAPLLDITHGLITTFLPYLFAWCPVLNPLIVFYIIGEIRTYAAQKLKRVVLEIHVPNICTRYDKR